MGGVDSPLTERLVAAFRWVDPGAQITHEVSDTSGWWREASLLASLGPALVGRFPDTAPTVVVAPETGGFLLGPLVAQALGTGFVAAYKDGRGRVGDRMLRQTAPADYRGRTVELSIRAGSLSPTDRVLVVDDWTATGAQLRALRALVGDAGAEYVGAAVIVDGCQPSVAAELGVRSLLHRQDLDSARVDRVH